MKSVLTALCKGHPARWPQFIKQCQRLINGAVHDTTGEQPYYLMFNRRAPRRIGAELTTIDQDHNVEIAMEIVRRTNQERANKWRERANVGRKNQSVEVNQLVWVKRDYTTSQIDKRLGVKWIGPYKVKERLREGGAYILEDVFDGTEVQRAADKVKPYVGQGEILVGQLEIFTPGELDDSESEEEGRPVRERRPVRKYIEEDEDTSYGRGRQPTRTARENRIPPRRNVEESDSNSEEHDDLKFRWSQR